MSDFDFRFGGIGRLIGTAGLARLRAAHVAVVGIGGVGSWTVEALARSGVGKLTLIDLDEVCISNVNRQLHATNDSVGRAKVEVMAERVRAIHPECDVQAVTQFFTEETARDLLDPGFDHVVDAIDTLSNKCLLISLCRARGISLVTCGGAGGRRDPTQVRISDLAVTSHDRLLQKVRDVLRKDFGFPRGEVTLGIPCVHSREAPVFPRCDGTVSDERDKNSALRLNCESGFGTATFVTGTFGFAAASVVVEAFSKEKVISDR